MSCKNVKEILEASGFTGGELPKTILTLTPDGDNNHGHGELVEAIFSHLDYLPLEKLRIHEEVIKPARRALAKKIRRDMEFTWPLLVSLELKEEIEAGISEGRLHEDDFRNRIMDPAHLDCNEGRCRIVLDGTHRTESIRYLSREFGINKAPVLQFKYGNDPVEGVMDDSVGLSPWCRSTPAGSMKAPKKTFGELVGEGVLVKVGPATPDFVRDKRDNRDKIEENSIPLIAYDGTCYTFGEYLHDAPHEVEVTHEMDTSSVVSKPVKRAVKRDYELSKEYLEVDSDENVEGTEYLGFEGAIEAMEDTQRIVVFPRNVTKLDVIELAWAGDVFPRKTTRHVFSFRVFDLPIELTRLVKEEGSLKDDLYDVVRNRGRNLYLNYLGKNIHIMEGKKERFYPDHMFKFVWED